MVENILYLSPVWILGLGVLTLLFCYARESSVSLVFRLAKIFASLGWATSVIFYNRSAFPEIMSDNAYTILFINLMFFAMLATLFLSKKWYASMNMTGSLFCCGLLLSGVSGVLLVTSHNLGLTAAAVLLLLFSNYLLFIHADKRKDIYLSSQLYAFSAVVAAVLLMICVGFLYWQNPSLDYDVLGYYFENGVEKTVLFLTAAALVLIFVFLLGLSPLHFWYTETTGQIVLPVFSYFTLVPVGICWAAFIKLNAHVLSAMEPSLTLLYQGLALLSLFMGAVGACSGKNIRKIFAFGVVYQQGIVFLILQRLTPDALNTAFIYMFVYLLAMYGVCACLYGLKNKGEYLFMLSDFEGAAFRRPYIAATMTIFLFSLIGFPPFLGFLGLFSVVNDLIQHHNIFQLGLLFIALLILSYAYLQIIKTMYFENSNIAFDRADRGIYLAIMLTVLLMILIMLQPHYLIQDLEWILEGALTWQ